MLLPQSIERIISSGGNVSVDAGRYLPQSLERFAAIAKKSGVDLTLRNCGRLLPQSLERIAIIGEGKVRFILDE